MVGPRFVSLRTKLALVLIAFLVLTLGTLGLFLNLALTRTLQAQTIALEKRYAENVQQSINQVLFAGKYQVQAYVEGLVRHDPGLRYVAVIDRETRRAIAHSDPAMVGKRFDDPMTERAFTALDQNAAVAQASKLPNGEPIHDVSLPFLRGYLHEPAGIIRIGTSTATLWSVVNQTRAISLLIILGCMAAGLVMAFGVSIRISSRLYQLVEAVKRFGEGDPTASAPVKAGPQDEVNLLAENFNEMAEKLTAYAEDLEQQVDARTRELAEANASLAESEQLLRLVVTNTPLILFATDPQGRVILSEGKGLALFGLHAGELVGKSLIEIYPTARNLLERALAGEQVHETFETQGLVLEEWLSPALDKDGAVSRVIGVAIDVTERMRLEAQLRGQYERLKELDRLKSNFVNAVTHELRTPLTSIMGYAEFLEDEIGGSLAESQQEFVRQIQRGSRRLEYLLNDLLDFARIEAGTFRLRLATADLGQKMREIVDSLRPQAEEGGICLMVDLPDAPLVLRMDAQRIGQVLINLIGNALKFTEPGGQISVSARHEGTAIRCEVKDTGIGIAPEDIPKLFQRFSQLESGVKQGKGTGLGLSISKALVEAHGGTIGVNSEPRRGSTFWFTLPVESTQASDSAQADEEAA